ncbi:hypothetical protein [Aneurinibacillus migulanus]|uniref:hypothetical protein n=1 Tax=Aneurinibacillus migulanus TaxID=47500 RepID=UPI0020A05A7C|nr:hypothetical protein [Aneurinibacillus migulanus]MCP1354113.1 hypothetical protein [Aneurinibacillus migulanus]
MADRYPLAKDVAEQIAQRLGVSTSYLLCVSIEDEDTLHRADQIFSELSKHAVSVSESYVNALKDRDDALTLKLTTALMKTVYYQQLESSSCLE